MDYTMEKEEFARAKAGIEVLFNKHREEVGSFGEYPIDPEWSNYRLLSDSGLLHNFILRHHGTVVGYYITLVVRHPHYAFKTAENDIIYISPEHRGTIAIKFLKWVDEQLKELGVNFINIGVKPMRDFSIVLKRMGYKLLETRYYKEVQ